MLNQYSDEFIAGFRTFDKDGSGWMFSSEIRNLLTTLGEKLRDDEVEKLLEMMKDDDKGKVNYEDFIRMVMGD